MALVLADRVQETTTTAGTGALTLSGAVSGFQSFAIVGNTNTCYYTIVDGATWEVGIGTYSTVGPTLTRTTIISNSSGTTSPLTLSSASKPIFLTYPAEKSVNLDADGVATIGQPLSYVDTGNIATFASTVAGYNQVVVQNKSAATNASSNFNVSNNAATSTTGYAEIGINSSTFSNGTGSFNIAGAAYLASASTDLTIGTYGAYNLHFVANSSATDAMTIFTDSGMSLNGLGNPGPGNIAISNAVVGLTAITSAAGTTILTSGSTQIQAVSGTLTQTIQLPQATTLLKGTTYTIANASTGLVTVKDNASTTLLTLTTGGAAQFLCLNNATSAGTWGVRVFASANTTWGNTALNYTGNITSATWQGNPVAYNYGGTGLTTFTGANNALYSTSATALTAGTLPVLAGGTGSTTATGSGSVVLATSPTLVTPLLGTPTSGNFSTGTFTWPTFNQNTSGNATTATTATNLTGGSAGTIPYQSAAGTTVQLGAGTSGYVLQANGAAAPSWVVASTAAGVNNGTLTMAVAGTGLSGSQTFTANQATGATFTVTSNATNANTASTIVARDASGNFTAGTITAALSGNASTATSATSATTATTATNLAGGLVGSIPYQSSAGATALLANGTTGQVLQANTSAAPSWVAATAAANNGTLTMAVAGTGLSGSQTFTANQATGATFTVTSNATNANTASTIVARDASGNFTAGTITAALSGNATSATNSTTVGGLTPSATAGVGSRVVAADASGYINNTYFNSTDNSVASGVTGVMIKQGDSYLRTGTAAAVATFISGQTLNIAGSSTSCTGNAATATTATNLSGGTVAATTITATGNITAYYSDDRLKTRLGNIENAVAKIRTLDTFYYEANETAQALGYEATREVGISAQQVQAVMPETVAPAPIDAQYLTVRYERLIPLLIAAAKEQDDKIARLEALVAKLLES